MHTICKSGPNYKTDLLINQEQKLDYEIGLQVVYICEDISNTCGLVELETLSLTSADSSLIKSILGETHRVGLILLL